MNDIRIITLLPTRGVVFTEVENALDLELAKNRQAPVILRTHDLPLPASRNFLIESALKEDWWTHALLVDDDVVIPEGGLKELIKMNTDVALMDYPAHTKKEGKFCGTITRNKDKSVVYGGLGAVLVKREVLEKIEQPWFVATAYRLERLKDGNIGFYVNQTNEHRMDSAGEDTYFYLQCRKYKFEIKESKLTAKHLRLEQFVTTTHTGRYSQQHKIISVDKIETEIL